MLPFKPVSIRSFPIHRQWSLALLSILLLTLLAGCTAQPATSQISVAASDPSGETLPATISLDEAATMYTAGAFLLDVRQPEEWNEVHIPNTTLIPLGDLEQRLNELPKDQPIIVICRSGNRSTIGRDILLKAGFNATSVTSGVNKWKAAGYPTTTGP